MEALSQTPVGALTQQAQYNDIYVRAHFDDIGLVPRPTQGLSGSPDIIPYGGVAVSDPYKTFLTDNWNQDVGRNVNAEQANYLYMRGQNLSTQAREGNMYLYYSRAALLLWPANPLNNKKGWKYQGLLTASGARRSPVKAAAGGDKVVTTDPFYWAPDALPANDHYCLIGRIETQENPNPIPSDLTSVRDFAEYLSLHANLCWRNVQAIAPTAPTTTASVRYDQGVKAEQMNFQLKGTNVPVGADVSFTCGSAPGINLPRTRVSAPNFSFGIYCDVPANFSADISYTYYNNDLYPPKLPMKIELVAIFVVDADDDRLYPFGKPLEELALSQENIAQIVQKRRHNPDAGPLRGIAMGSYTMASLDAR